MPRTVDPRPLTTNEVALIHLIADAVGGSAAATLKSQLNGASVIGGLPLLLDLAVAPGTSPASIANGPVPVRAFVSNMRGEILLWVRDGYLDGLEYACVADDRPTEMPAVAAIRIEREQRS